MDSLRKDYEQLSKKQKTGYTKNVGAVDRLLSICQDLQTKLKEPLEPSEIRAQSLLRLKGDKIKETLESDQKELHSALNKLGKTVDKVFDVDVQSSVRDVHLDHSNINQLIAMHLYRTGQFEVGQAFCQSVGVELPSESLHPFIAMHTIVNALLSGDLGPAQQWVNTHKEQLQHIGSNVEFMLAQLGFIQLLKGADRMGAVKFAWQHLSPLSARHVTGVQRLMCALAFVGKLDSSPYRDLLNPGLLAETAAQLTRDSCMLSGMSYESPIDTLVNAGYTALPIVLKMSAVLNQKELSNVNVPLPYEVDLGPGCHFHSIFTCPVSKEQSTNENRPMLLKCGHVLLEASLAKLGRSASHRFKCPYCPVEQTREHARPVHF